MDQNVISRIKEIVGDEFCKTSTAELYTYSMDASIHKAMPDAVVRPGNTEEVSKIVKLANELKFPIIPRGAGSALCGHSVPVDGGVVIDMQRMDEIKDIRVGDLYVVVEPGVVCDDLNKALKQHGFWIPGPSSSNVATAGGMVATNSSGDKALKYGATRDYVLGLEVVLPTGEIVQAGSRTIKNSGGYQFEKFFVGMEGTLGIITEIIFKVIPLPDKRAAAVAAFEDIEEAGQCVSNIIANKILPSGLELMSNVCIRAVNKALDLGLPEVEAILLIEVDGDEAIISKTIEKVSKICKDSGASTVDFTDDEKRIVELWKGRKGMIPSLSKLNDDFVTVMLADDMSVPISQVPCAITEFQKISDKFDIIVASYGHAGDGNLHTKVLMDPTKKSHWEQAEKAVKEIYDVVLDLGGTTTGEHGIALTKAPFLHKERGPLIPTMRAIKKAMDPNNIMNPHKMMDWEGSFITHVRYKLEGD
jgi:glycolate oxidase